MMIVGFSGSPRKNGNTDRLVQQVLMPLLVPNFISRLKKHPGLLCVFTQGNADASAFRAYMDKTNRFLGLLGFTPKGCLAAVATREKADLAQQTDVLAQARAGGATLAHGA